MSQSENHNRRCVTVAVSLPVRECFSYSVPENLARTAQVGCAVLVPFKNRKVTGYIIETTGPEKGVELKEIEQVLEPGPLFHESMVPFFKWMSDYYMHPVGKLIQSLLPGGLKRKTYKVAKLTRTGRQALESLPHDSPKRTLLLTVEENQGKRCPLASEQLNRLLKDGLIKVDDMVKRAEAGPLMRSFVRAADENEIQRLIKDDLQVLKAAGEKEFLKATLSDSPVPVCELTKRFSNGSYLVEKWVKKGLLSRYRAEVYRDPFGKTIKPPPVPERLFSQQEKVVAHLTSCLEKGSFSSCLLFGVTGSGKTEVYFRAVEQVIRLRGQAIIMVPEISLSFYMVGLFRERLGKRTAIYHSGLSQGERYDQWMRIVRGEVDLVIGARSALFAPLSRLRLIIVDEEYDYSYKQDSNPRYQARDAAVVRAKMEKAVVVLGGGTPSVQSFHNCESGRYQLLKMPERVESRPFPDIEIVDMKGLEQGPHDSEIISPRLKQEIEKNLNDKKQAILFLNRRGFNPIMLCRSCGKTLCCPNCDVALTYHRKEDKLLCHYCGYYAGEIPACPSCGKGQLKALGFGTEKLEHELGVLFPEARIARMDTDSTRKKGVAMDILKAFGEGAIDLLVGTQMIAKGYDFAGVTLVGVVNADFSLGFPDFRAAERTFQLISQVAGRAGRGRDRGRVIIQTYNPEHYAIRSATENDYAGFFKEEKELRGQLGYPPFSYLACLRLKGNDSARTAESADQLGRHMKWVLSEWPRRGKEIQVLGPVEAPLSKIKGKYRWQLLVKSKNPALMRVFLGQVEAMKRSQLRSMGVNLVIDIDPYQML